MNADEVGGIVRAVVAGIGGYFVGKGMIDQQTMMTIAGAIATIGTAIWSVIVKRKAAS